MGGRTVGGPRRGRWCGNRIDLHPRADGRPIALHPAELAAADTPTACHRRLSCGIAPRPARA
ncbi:DUF6083 domain-containing protein [Streptomyces sp. HGB0020]|uniref:DUF6083 domain-containing protein n=1 Tax=Streptomyces sp. HGB0020 TaxID=1078086 RepID=UPI002D218A5F|nr:DUF6083 domain-containing protein [Streptomyces sp. HGB0020]